ncbi:MAG: phage tail assembly protein [Zymomonas mobilis]|uniref:phage tail assembly protein n=1 Tax=Zymomonas mobilis TaxID=542 RepID=UPI0039EAB9EE
MENENNASTTVTDQAENTTVNAVNSAASVQPETVAANPATDTASNAVTLGYALMRGDQEIKTISFRTPVAGDLRGLGVVDLCNNDIDQMSKFLPRITMPALMPSEIEKLPLSDYFALSVKALDFFSNADQSQTA